MKYANLKITKLTCLEILCNKVTKTWIVPFSLFRNKWSNFVRSLEVATLEAFLLSDLYSSNQTSLAGEPLFYLILPRITINIIFTTTTISLFYRFYQSKVFKRIYKWLQFEFCNMRSLMYSKNPRVLKYYYFKNLFG